MTGDLGPPRRGSGPAENPDRATNKTTASQRIDTAQNISVRLRAGLRASAMIDAAAHQDLPRFGTLYDESERAGEASRKWLSWHLARAASHYATEADLETMALHGIQAVSGDDQ